MGKQENDQEIKITPEMIEAARQIFDLHMDPWEYGAAESTRDDLISSLFRVMVQKSRCHCAERQGNG